MSAANRPAAGRADANDGREPQTWNQLGSAYDFAPFEGTPKVYLLATSPRCGGHWLGHALCATGSLGAPLEYFSRGRVREWRALLGVEEPGDLLEAWFRRRTSPSGWFGVKAHWPQYRWFTVEQSNAPVVEIDRVVRLTREDVVAQAVSLAIAQETGAWISFHARRSDPSYDFARIEAALGGILQQEAAWTTFLATADLPVLHLRYESVAADLEAAVQDVSSFCGVAAVTRDAAPFAWRPERQSTAINAVWRERFEQEYRDLYGVEPPTEATSAT